MSDEWRMFLNSPLGAVLGFAAGTLLVYLVAIPLFWWLDRRKQRRWQQQEAERQRQWVLQRQLWEMEQQIREERLSEADREWQRQYREEQAEVKREARRRLGLPDEEERYR